MEVTDTLNKVSDTQNKGYRHTEQGGYCMTTLPGTSVVLFMVREMMNGGGDLIMTRETKVTDSQNKGYRHTEQGGYCVATKRTEL